ncbi:hypothetical protein PSACC_03491 [Paramicrosporidium saccamoebae]|uniref:MICOS complex subunit n=1 Tax=Paramicrosporidium saccamoebae TaxID=1246581 RepID=A0A2H9TG75_9FUNG|nr:hypothetical protein PSACC_03491 [Paramicrosporidium saccamoebae]
MNSSQKSDALPSPPSRYYDDLDEFGYDRKLPPSLEHEFHFEPNILSEKLVLLQRFIHENHGTVEYYIDRTVDSLFYTERQVLRGFRWLREDMPSMILPSAQVAASASLGYFANHPTPLGTRLFFTTSMGLMAGFLVFPSWRRRTAELAQHHIVEPLPAVQNALVTTRRGYNGFVMYWVSVWDSYDHAVASVKNKLADTRYRIISFFKPPRSNP